MPLSTEAVLGLLQSVAAEVVTPRFRSLSESQIDEKRPGDLVTVADREAEELITARCWTPTPTPSCSARRPTPAGPS